MLDDSANGEWSEDVASKIDLSANEQAGTHTQNRNGVHWAMS